jgi:hypothetical protein
MIVTEVPPVTRARKAAGLRTLVMALRCRSRTAGICRRIEHGYWRLYHFRYTMGTWRVRHDPDAWLKHVRLGTVPDHDPGPQDDPEIYFEDFDPEDWSGSTVN